MKPATLTRGAMAIAMAFLFLIVPISSCKKKGPIPFDTAFATYISAFTSGSVSAASTIRIRLTDAFMGVVNTAEPVADELIDFSPEIDGKLWWIDNQTLEFRPAKWLPRGKVFEGSLALNRITIVPSNLSEFRFSFVVMQQHVDVQLDQIKPYRNDDLKWMYMSGTMSTMDVCDASSLPKTISATENGKNLSVNWTNTGDPHLHQFIVDSIARTDNDERVLLSWNGSEIEAEQKGEFDQEIPSLSNFKMFFHKVVQQPEQYIQLQFSDPLLPNQTLAGIIDLDDANNERYTIEGNEVRVYPAYRMSGSHNLHIHAGVKNIMGYASPNDVIVELEFEDLKPEVKIDDMERVILPSTSGLVFPFRAVNLSAVDIIVMRIYESNVPQFLQVNDLNGNREMRRVGHTVKRKTIQLNSDGKTDLAVWNTFYLNLDEIIKTEPGAIYRVEINFRQTYSLYHCADHDEKDNANAGMEEIQIETDDEEEAQNASQHYNEYDDYYYEEYDDYDDDYDWKERNNPCNSAYYRKESVGKNILASDVGMIAKRGGDGSLLVSVSDIRSTKPMSGVDIEVLNYQQQVLSKMRTDGNGHAKFDKVIGVPYLIVAKQDNQRGYLKVDGSHALSLNTFDIGGEISQKGLKGFIYGERGVWRPGDSLFLTFILEDEKKVLPEMHPVTFELINPRGQVVQKFVKSKGENGFYSFTCSTDPDAPTGNYQSNIRVGGAVFSKSLKVETIKPNRLKLTMNFGNPEPKVISGDINAVLQVKWLHGAIAKNLKANVTATFTRSNTFFEKFKEYTFDDPVRGFSAEEQTVYDGFVNDEGKATINMKADLQGRTPGMLNANFSVKVFEEGGDFSVDRFSALYAPYNCFVGVNIPKPKEDYTYYLETGKDHMVSVVTVDPNGKPIQQNNLQWKLYKVGWRWWWERSSNDLSNYVGGESSTPVSSGSISTNAEGKGQFNVKVMYPDWGRYLIRVEDPNGGHASGREIYIDWPATENRSNRTNPDGANVLAFSMDKEKYISGEECIVTIPSGKVGRALVSIENSSGVIDAQWVETKEGQTQYKFKTSDRMTPNAYVHITLIQPHNQTENDLPIRLFGVMPVFVENPGSHLSPVIGIANELSPEKEFEVKVSEEKGKAMTYTLEIVDEGLLDLTRFKTPDPWNYFYAREALGVNTFDLYDQVIGAFGTKLERLLSLGGDAEVNGQAKNRANRFKPVVLHAGPYTIAAGKSMTHKFTMPNYIGSVRVMVVAGRDMAYGNAQKSVPVKKALMVLASLPRVLGPGEEVKLPVTIFAMDDKIKDVTVKVEPNDFFQLIEGGSKNIQFKQQGDDVVNFPIRVNEKVGVGKVNVIVTSGNFKATYEVEMDVRNPNPNITNVVEGIVEGGKSWTANFDLAGMDGTNTSVIEVSSIPPIDFGKRLKYLLDYPHGCVEQTTSAVFPQLYLSDVMDLQDAEIKRAMSNVKEGINRLAKFQLRSGGMSYWPGDAMESEWGSNYAGHFMLEAKKKGYTLPPGWENAWIVYQQRKAQEWNPQNSNSGNYYWYENDLVQAYRLYTLALAGKPKMGAMNRMKERASITLAARWRLAAAYALAGQPEAAKAIVFNQSTFISPYVSLAYSYGSNWRDEAMIIETLTLMGDKVKAAPLVKELAAQLSIDSWYSTQTVAYSLLAISQFAAGEAGKNMAFTYSMNGNASNRTTAKPVSSNSLDVKKVNGNKLDFNNTGTNLLYVRIINTGQPKNGDESAASNNLVIDVKYTNVQGLPINVARIDQGTDFIAEVSIYNPGIRGRYDELALTQIFPSGWEIINQRMDVSAVVMNADQPEYQDVRDDRVYSYLDLNPNQSKRFRVKLNATYLGKFYLPAVSCEAMYDRTINARTAGRWVEVVQPGGGVAMKK